MTKLFFGNVEFSASAADLRDWLEQRGFTAERVTIPRERDNERSKGYAFVEFYDQGLALQCIDECHDETFMRRKLNISRARSTG